MPDEKMIIGDGVCFRSISEQKFKTAKIALSLLVPLTAETAAVNAILPGLLSRSCAKYPDFTALKRRLAMLYGAGVSGSSAALGDAQVLTLAVSALDDRYTLGGESVSAECAELLREMIFRPNFVDGLFTHEDVEAEKRELREQLEAQKNDKMSYARQRCAELMCAGEPHGVNPLGSIETIDAITPETAAEAWRGIINSAQVDIISIGAVDADAVRGGLGGAFAGRSGYTPLPETMVMPAPDTAREHVERQSVTQSNLVLGYRTPIADGAGDAQAMRLMCDCLGGTVHSRLFQNVREKLSLCYFCFSLYNKQKGLMFVQSGLESKNITAARDEIAAQIKYIQDGKLTDEEIESAKLSRRNLVLSVKDSVKELSDWYRAQLLSPEVLSPLEAAHRAMRVTAEQIIQAANTLALDTAYILTGNNH